MEPKAKSILGWIFPIVAIVFLCIKDTEKEVKHHAACAVTVFGLDVIISVVLGIIPVSIPFVSTIVSILYLVVIILGIVAAAKDQKAEIPLITDLAESIFAKAIGE